MVESFSKENKKIIVCNFFESHVFARRVAKKQYSVYSSVDSSVLSDPYKLLLTSSYLAR